jgi:uncharacterized membrane protein YeaQ/YmgE (transglycosylase-associated protein family)
VPEYQPHETRATTDHRWGGWAVASADAVCMLAKTPEAPVSLETFLLWIAIGLIAGWLASAVVGGGYGVVGDIVVGVVGAFLGGWLFHAFHVASPISGIAGTIFVAFIGAVVLLLLLRLIHRSTG